MGTEISIHRLKDLGKVAIVAGSGQVILTGAVTFGLAKIFGFELIESVYLAVALTFSSTVIAVKLLYEKKDINSTYGQICIGILIVQDVLAILALLVLAGFQEGSFSFDYWHFGWILVQGGLLTVATMFLATKVLRHVYARIANSQELLIITGLSWCFIISLLAGKIGFSKEIGAFIAGLSLANLPYTFEINVKTKVLRDFFITLFFVGLGAGMTFVNIGDLILPAIVFSLFVIIGNPLIVLFLMGRLGYDKRTSLFTGLAIANISEFSLIVIALGKSLGHLNDSIVSMVTIIALCTMSVSSYMILNNNYLYKKTQKYLDIFLLRDRNHRQFLPSRRSQNHIVLLGCGTMGRHILEQILSFKEDYIVVDHDNSVIKKLINMNVPCIYGDIEDEELLDELDLEDAEIVISTLPNPHDHYFLLKKISEIPPEKQPILITVANSGREGLDLFNQGVDYVILKPYLGASHVHGIHRELYKLESEFSGIPVISPDSVSKLHDSLERDIDYAHLIENLNKLRLREIIYNIEHKKDAHQA